MPLKQTYRKRESQSPEEHEQAKAPVMQAGPAPGEAGPGEPGRPHQAYVESVARKYWQEMVDVGKLTKPAQQEIRAAAMPILCQARRSRPDPKFNPPLNRAHMAVNAVQLHAAESGWIKHPFTLSEASPDYVEALIQLADDIGWLAREIPLPEHPEPHHPPIYYTIDPKSGEPVPREDSLICAKYVTREDGSRVTQSSHIHPCLSPEGPNPCQMAANGWDICYTLERGAHTVRVFIYILEQADSSIEPKFLGLSSLSLRHLHFSPYPPTESRD